MYFQDEGHNIRRVIQYPNSENWLYEEVSTRLLVASITFKAKSGKFNKVSEIYFISLLFFDTNFNRTKHKV